MARKQTAKNPNNEQLSFSDYELKEVSVRLVLNEDAGLYSPTPLRTPQDAVDLLGDMLRGSDRERVLIINLDNKLRGINFHTVAIGDSKSAMVPIANCFKTAIMEAATAVLLLHCHPSGDASPSQEDFEVTRRFVQAGKLLDIPAMDHVIIGAYRGEQYSFRENNPDMFYEEPDLTVFPEMDPGKGWSTAERQPLYTVDRKVARSHGISIRKTTLREEEKTGRKASVIGRLEGKRSVVREQTGTDQKKPAKKQEYSLG